MKRVLEFDGIRAAAILFIAVPHLFWYGVDCNGQVLCKHVQHGVFLAFCTTSWIKC